METNLIDTPEKLDAYARGLDDGAKLAKLEPSSAIDKAMGMGMIVGVGLGVVLTILFAPMLVRIFV